MNFLNKIVLVTGAANGIGRGIALEYAKKGATVLVADIDILKAKDTVAQIENDGGTAFAYEVNVRNASEVVELFNVLKNQFGGLDILINNEGVSRWKSPYELDVEEWDEIINTNLRGVFLCSREAAKIMRQSGGGSIVNIASTRAIMSEPNSEAYAASKGGIVALTHAMAASFAPDHIQVNCISPGWIETGDYSQLSEKDHKQHFSQRVGKPEDIAKACMYLTQSDNQFVNGVNLIVDGGMTRKMIYEE
ncbi:glucose 1-dehydrogenase [Carboxylicivirga caseinilyticus]|uniref:glucose 1-dehydrogenase n=1 Tax=Carboxylicivirga caseinilyticus TaxID=3417572 RepID=UPI003D33EC79|nr:SDR family oxidoreductase [Marinilabiliaceae bacterium A049]